MTVHGSPADVLGEILGEILATLPVAGTGAVMLGVDGVDGVGKTTVADAMADALRVRRRPVVRVGLDDFLRPARQRYARGRSSAEGYFRDSVDVEAFRASVVAPARAGLPVTPRVFDHRADVPLVADPVPVDGSTVVVVDGLFLHRPELVAAWDVSGFLDAPSEATAARMGGRDATPTDPGPPANARYVGGQRLYLAECRPARLATVVVDLTDLGHPRIVPGE